MKARRLFAILIKELRQLRRDRISLAMIIGIPVLQLMLFGYAINLDVRHLPAGVADASGTFGSRALVQDLFATGVIAPAVEARTPQELLDLIRKGEISVGIVVPRDFERRRIEGRPLIQVMVDGSDTVVQQAARQLAQVPVGGTAALVPVQVAGEKHASVPREGGVSVVSFFNPQRSSAVNIVPGLIGVILTMTMVLFTAMAIVREHERGNMELLITTPITRSELMIGKVLPYVGIGLVQTTAILLLGTFLFRVPIRGSLLDVYIAALLLITANLTLGLLISTRAKSQFQAMQMAFFIFLPSILLSGFMFPFTGMPIAAQHLAQLLPLTHFIRLIRGVMLRHASIWDMWPEVVALVAFTTVMLTASITRFRKRLD